MQPRDFNTLYPGLNSGQIGIRLYALRCIAHRLRKFGFEDGINLLTPADLAVLASYMQGEQRKVLNEEVHERLAKIA